MIVGQGVFVFRQIGVVVQKGSEVFHAGSGGHQHGCPARWSWCAAWLSRKVTLEEGWRGQMVLEGGVTMEDGVGFSNDGVRW